MAESAITECATDVCQLYRHFDINGDLLYVGMSLSAVGRLAAHKSTARWFSEIARVEVENFSSRGEAATAEAAAIVLEKPRYNIAGRQINVRVSIAKLRREQPNNPDAMLICEELERLLAETKPTIDCPTCEARKATTRNRVAAFRKRRATLKDNGTPQT